MIDFQLKKAVITGGSGGVGIALIHKLINEGVRILVLQRPGSARSANIPQHELIEIEYVALDQLYQFNVKETDYDVFFHLGWTNTEKENRNDIQKQNENVIYSCEAVKLAHRLGCHTFIGAGSQAEYGRVKKPLTEDMICNPVTAYGIMKLCACHATRMLCQQYNMRHIWTRILSAYGTYDNENSVLISTIINHKKLQVLDYTSGEQIWDFVYLDDVADAFYLSAKYGRNGAVYPIGSGQGRSLREFIEILGDKLGCRGKMCFGARPYSANEVMYLVADIGSIQRDTGWEPKTSFEEGIDRTIAFYT